MGSNDIAWCERMLHRGINVNVIRIEATVSMEINRRHLLHFSDDSPSTSNLLFQGHCWPYLMQLSAFGVFHDDILALDVICSYITPFEDFRDGNRCCGLH